MTREKRQGKRTRRNYNFTDKTLERLAEIMEALEAVTETEALRHVVSLGHKVFVAKSVKLVDQDGRQVHLF